MRKVGKYEKMRKRALLQTYMISLASLMLCVTMFLGTTMAWFTDTVKMPDNQLHVGTLNVQLKHASYNDGVLSQYTDVTMPSYKVFTSDIKWEPGYTAVEAFKVIEHSDLAFSYNMTIDCSFDPIMSDDNNEVVTKAQKEAVAKAITVWTYVGESDKTFSLPKDFAALSDDSNEDWKKIGTLYEVIDEKLPVFEGKMTSDMVNSKDADGTDVQGIAYHYIALNLDEKYGNDENDIEIYGASLDQMTISLIANQMSSESDAFGPIFDYIPNGKKADNLSQIKNGDYFLDTDYTIDDGTAITATAPVNIDFAYNTLTRATASGNPFMISSTQPVTIENAFFESIKGSAVIATRTHGANITIKNCEFTSLAAPSTGNVGIQVYAENVTIAFEGCVFNNMPIVTNSSYPKGLKMAFNDCTFNWVGDNCPGMVQLENYVEADIDFNQCKFTYETSSQYNTAKDLIVTRTATGRTTIDFNDLEVIGVRNNDNIWDIVGRGGVTSGNNVTVTISGDATYTFNGNLVDIETYKFK